jgi:LmbE family N-acetylglucosaminyl deacetylase
VAVDGAHTSADAWRSHAQWGKVPPLTLTNGDEVCSRLVVVAAHPVDESLGAGGLIATAHRSATQVYVVLLTAGEAPTRTGPMSRHALATQRLAEVEQAVQSLAPGAPVVYLGAAGGEVIDCEEAVAASLTELIGDGDRTMLVAPWRRDGHPDHDAAGRAAVEAARRTRARLVEYPIRAWQDRSPDHAPWREMRRLDLDPEVVRDKARAVAAHVSQVCPDPRGLAPAILPDRVLAHFRGAVEHFLVHDPRRDG